MERTHALDRWLYQGNRPNRLARLVNGASARLAAAGIGPARLVMLEVTGRRTGKTISFPVVVADYQGERYLVSMLGQGFQLGPQRTRGRRACRAAARTS